MLKPYDAQKVWLRRSYLQRMDEDSGNAWRLSGARDGQKELQLAVLGEDVSHSISFLPVRQLGRFTVLT